MRAPPLVATARHFGGRVYEHVRHGLIAANRAIETGARLYGGVIQPLAQMYGVNTGALDSSLMGAYSDYSNVRSAIQHADHIIQS